MEKERKRNENQYNSHHDRFPRAIKYSNKNIFTNQDVTSKMMLHGPIFNAMLLREKSIRVISPLRLHQMIANIPTR